jgi:hypothetical protein
MSAQAFVDDGHHIGIPVKFEPDSFQRRVSRWVCFQTLATANHSHLALNSDGIGVISSIRDCRGDLHVV